MIRISYTREDPVGYPKREIFMQVSPEMLKDFNEVYKIDLNQLFLTIASKLCHVYGPGTHEIVMSVSFADGFNLKFYKK